jgi:hypothetical protein
LWKNAWANKKRMQAAEMRNKCFFGGYEKNGQINPFLE